MEDMENKEKTEELKLLRDIHDDNNVYKNLLDGKWVESSSDKTIDINSPSDGKRLGSVQAMSREEVDRAIEGTKEALKEWAVKPMSVRADILYRAADIMDENAEFLAHILAEEIAKDYKSSLSEVKRSAEFIRYTADAGQNVEGESIQGDNFPGGSRNKLSIVTRSPVGTVLCISPFNYPINLSVSKIAPALIGGNTCILKPPTQGSVSALHVAEIFNMAGLPASVLNTVTGKGSEIGDYLVTHEGVNFINFTGSTAVGKRISLIASMVPQIFELGGKDAALVLNDCDMLYTADMIVTGAYSYSGQRCTAVKRVLVMDECADEMVNLLKERVEKLKTGFPMEEGVTVTPLISEEAADYVQELIDDALSKGATLICGNRRNKNLMWPTLLDNVTEDMRIAWEEPFGPVLPVIRVKNEDEAVELSNRSQYGLQASVFTQDVDKAFTLANALEVGTVQINNRPERGPDNFPFLGVKDSGMGTQGVRYSILAMTRPKAIVVTIRPESMKRPPGKIKTL